jgi:hypothetical protein
MDRTAGAIMTGQAVPKWALLATIYIGEPWEGVVASVYRLLPTSRLGDSPLQRSGEAELSRTRVGKLFRVERNGNRPENWRGKKKFN